MLLDRKKNSQPLDTNFELLKMGDIVKNLAIDVNIPLERLVLNLCWQVYISNSLVKGEIVWIFDCKQWFQCLWSLTCFNFLQSPKTCFCIKCSCVLWLSNFSDSQNTFLVESCNAEYRKTISNIGCEIVSLSICVRTELWYLEEFDGWLMLGGSFDGLPPPHFFQFDGFKLVVLWCWRPSESWVYLGVKGLERSSKRDEHWWRIMDGAGPASRRKKNSHLPFWGTFVFFPISLLSLSFFSFLPSFSTISALSSFSSWKSIWGLEAADRQKTGTSTTGGNYPCWGDWTLLMRTTASCPGQGRRPVRTQPHPRGVGEPRFGKVVCSNKPIGNSQSAIRNS